MEKQLIEYGALGVIVATLLVFILKMHQRSVDQQAAILTKIMGDFMTTQSVIVGEVRNIAVELRDLTRSVRELVAAEHESKPPTRRH